MSSRHAAPLPEPFFLDVRGSRRFCIRYAPAGPARGAMLFVPALAEEMNKSRRTVAVQARVFADDGWSVLVPDLYGCGDSEGDFADAGWTQWRDDVIEMAGWLRMNSGHSPVLWAMRAGCLLAADAARSLASRDLVFWQPQVSGRVALQQLLRLRIAQQALSENIEVRETTRALREKFEQGETLEIAGYEVAPAVATGLDTAELAAPPPPVRAAWFEIVPTVGAEASAPTQASAEGWSSAGAETTLYTVSGEAFWQSQEIAECPTLVDATRAVVAGWRR